MKPVWNVVLGWTPTDPSPRLRRAAWRFAIHASACLGLMITTVSCSSRQSRELPRTLADVDLSSMSSDQLAHFVFEHHGCNNCHTLGRGGKLGFTDRGKEVGKNFEGCISLLTTMNVIAQVKEENRGPEDKQKATRFQEFGCTTCHQVTPGKLGLTQVGSKLASLHMACTDVQKILSQR